MNIYTLDELLFKDRVVDDYISLTWAERFWEFGDFELSLVSTSTTRSVFTPGTMLVIDKSRRVMVVEQVENKDDSEGRYVLTATGRSLEAILLSRSTRNMPGTGIEDTLVLTDVPMTIARNMFNWICRTNSVSPQDNIPYLQSGSLYPASTIPESIDPVTYEVQHGALYDTLNEISSTYGFGFRLCLAPEGGKLYFDFYMGDNRTSSQTTFPTVIFSPDMDTLTEVSDLTTAMDEKNVAYVSSANGSMMVYAIGTDPSISGFARKVVNVRVDSDLPAGTELNTLLEREGMKELAKWRPLIGFDGEVPENSGFEYDKDYRMGDLVEMRNFDGVINTMRVSEQIFVSDTTGVRSYPTLSLYSFITPGSWYSWGANKVWDDDTTSVWYDVP